MIGRLDPDRLRAVDEILETAGPFFEELVEKFSGLLATHELTAAHQAIFDDLDSTYAPSAVQWILTIAVGHEAVRRKETADGQAWAFGDPGADAMVVDEPNPVCNMKIQGEQYCGLDTGHVPPCAALGIVDKPVGERISDEEIAAALVWLNAQPVTFGLFVEILDQPWCATVTETGALADEVELHDGRRLVRIGDVWTLSTARGGAR